MQNPSLTKPNFRAVPTTGQKIVLIHKNEPLLASCASGWMPDASSASGLALGPVSDQSPLRRSRFNGGGIRSCTRPVRMIVDHCMMFLIASADGYTFREKNITRKNKEKAIFLFFQRSFPASYKHSFALICYVELGLYRNVFFNTHFLPLMGTRSMNLLWKFDKFANFRQKRL